VSVKSSTLARSRPRIKLQMSGAEFKYLEAATRGASPSLPFTLF
jgi:hypothetical protein